MINNYGGIKMTDKKFETQANETVREKQNGIENLPEMKWYSVLIPITGDKKIHMLNEYARRNIFNGTKRSDKIGRAIAWCGEGAMYAGKYIFYAETALNIIKNVYK